MEKKSEENTEEIGSDTPATPFAKSRHRLGCHQKGSLRKGSFRLRRVKQVQCGKLVFYPGNCAHVAHFDGLLAFLAIAVYTIEYLFHACTLECRGVLEMGA